MMTKKTQMGLEIVLMLSIIIIISLVFLQSVKVEQNYYTNLEVIDSLKTNCEKISNAITKAVEYEGLSNSIFNYPYILNYMLAAALFSGLLSGIFPAIHVSSVQPADSLKGSIFKGKLKRRGTKLLLVTQFSLSIVIIVFAQLFSKQLDYWLNNANFGYNRTNVAVIELPSEADDRRQILMNELADHPAVENIAASQNIPGLWFENKLAKLPSMPDEDAFRLQTYRVDYNFTEVFQIPLINGRYLDEKFNDENNILLNETAVKRFGLDNPIGEKVSIGGYDYTVAGVTEDFVFNDIGFEIDPSVIYLGKENFNYIVVKLSKEYSADIQQYFSQIWNDILPNIPFETYDMDTFFNDIWSMGFAFIGLFQLIGYFAVIFSFIGLIGLVSFMISRKTKEIGIRKVLGASISTIINKIVKEYFKLVVVANLIAAPLVYYLWNKIVQTGLLYMQPFDMSILFITTVATLIFAVLFVMLRIYKTASVNPSESLRYE